MPKSRKGQAVARSDLWALAGGVDGVVQNFLLNMRLQQSCRQFLDDLIRNKQEATEDLTDEEYIDMWENEEERRQYFEMRLRRLAKEDWTKIKWQPDSITHTFQKDGTSCGVFVMETVQKAKAESQRLENLCRELGCPENMVQQWTATRFNNCGDGNLGKRKENSEAIKRYNKQVPEEEGINEEMVESRLSVVGQGSGEESLIWPWEVHRTESTNILTKKIIFDVKDAAARREDPYS
ncbi:hypothetical protein ROHU_028278 [Labeo rohita]|uniref:Uncharacterized protein n=1 Tax=Labeo rohita TaxID=84645 RepID=A0A498MDP5_LABRO|nr:hypothetical protein ROHU_028278 [Labeo rohita]